MCRASKKRGVDGVWKSTRGHVLTCDEQSHPPSNSRFAERETHFNRGTRFSEAGSPTSYISTCAGSYHDMFTRNDFVSSIPPLFVVRAFLGRGGGA